MKVSDVMTDSVEYIHSDTTLKEAAGKMKALDSGFLPIGDSPDGKLKGVVTDRDIAIRGFGNDLGADATVERVKTDRVLYCMVRASAS